MAEVPYNPVPIAGQDEPTPRPSIPDVPAAFGATIATALRQSGADVEGAGQKLFDTGLYLQNLKNEADVNNAAIDYFQKQGKLDNDFRQLQGDQPGKALPGHLADMKDLYENTRSSFNNPVAQRMFDQMALRRFSYDTVNAADYAATAMKGYAKQSRDALRKENDLNIVNHPESDDVWNTGLTANQHIDAHESANVDGEPPEKTAQRQRDELARMANLRAQALVEKDPQMAQSFLDKLVAKKAIDELQAQTIQKTIWDRGIKVNAANVTAQVMQTPVAANADEQQTTIDRQTAAVQKIDEIYKNAPQFVRQEAEEAAQREVLNNVSFQKRALNDTKIMLQANVMQTLNQVLPDTKRGPINDLEAQRIDPNFASTRARAEALDPGFKTRIENAYRANSNSDNEPNKPRENNYLTWLGGSSREKMEYDAADAYNKGLITQDRKLEIQKYQMNGQHNAFMQDHVDSVLARHRDVLDDPSINARISATDQVANDRYNWFRGAMIKRIEQYQSAHKGAEMSFDEQENLVKELSKEVATGNKFFGTQTPEFIQLHNIEMTPAGERYYWQGQWWTKGVRNAPGQ